jgi:hypothetical protein
MYNAQHFFVENPLNRYSISARQLPAPDGPIYLVMRLYWPKATPPSILPPGKGTWKPPGIVKVN